MQRRVAQADRSSAVENSAAQKRLLIGDILTP